MRLIRVLASIIFPLALLLASFLPAVSGHSFAGGAAPTQIPGFADSARESAAEGRFLAVPDPRLAREHLRQLTLSPHIAGSLEDKATADFVARKFREAGLETEIAEYRVWMNYPAEIRVELTGPAGARLEGPAREHVEGDSYQDDPRVVMPFNAMSPSGDAEAEVVYANYGTAEDFKRLSAMKIDVRGKIVLVRYGQNFRGVKALLAQERGAAGLLIYSDPFDDGWWRGDRYPQGPWHPDTGVQRGSIGYMFEFPGDPTTPGVASLPSLPEASRTPPDQSAAMPKIPSTPISYADAWPILEHLGGAESPREWQGSLPFTYHVGPGPARIKLHLKQDYQYRTIWNVIGRLAGTDWPDQWVISGNHRDAWVYGAVDPGSGTAAMLEAVHGIGELMKSGWRPRRTLVFGSWDAEEFGLIGSTEWGEQHERELVHAVAYFNMDVAVSGPKFGASAVPSLKQFLRDVTKQVPSPKGGSLFDDWSSANKPGGEPFNPQETATSMQRPPAAQTRPGVPVGDLGSGSDYSVFLQHLGIPSCDIGSSGDYGVYHSVFDNFSWFTKFGDPDFRYEQEMARVFGLEAIRMADADVLPYDYQEYGKEIGVYLEGARTRAEASLGSAGRSFAAALAAANRMQEAGAQILAFERSGRPDPGLNQALIESERALLMAEGLPHRPWYRHAIYAPGEYTGYAAVVLPGVNEAIDRGDVEGTRAQLERLTTALDRAAKVLAGAHPSPRP